MRIIVDLHEVQKGNLFQNLALHSTELVKAICRSRGKHEIVIVLNGLFSTSIEPIRASFEALLPHENIRIWQGPVYQKSSSISEEIWHDKVCQIIKEGFIESLKPGVELKTVANGIIGPMGTIYPIGSELEEQALSTIEELEKWYALKDNAVSVFPDNTLHRPKLAYISPLPPEDSCISDYSAELLPILFHYYDIEVFVNQTGVTDEWINTNCHVRSVNWFQKNAHTYDRVLYHFGNSGFHKYMFPLLEEVPGIVVLHDFFLSDVVWLMANDNMVPDALASELYHSHGYKALLEFKQANDRTEMIKAYPCNYSVLQNAEGVIVLSENSQHLMQKWYGSNHTVPLSVIPQISLLNDDEQKTDKFEKVGRYYANVIEIFARSPQHQRKKLVRSIARIPNIPRTDNNLRNIAEAVAETFFDGSAQRQLLIDVSVLVREDMKTGIQRVVRSIVKNLIDSPPEGYRVEPVYATPDTPYRYARKFTLKSLECPEQTLCDEPLEIRPGDIFFIPDLHFQVVTSHQEFYLKIRNKGASVYFLVHDILPIQYPQYFPCDSFEDFQNWLKVVVQSDGAICVSRTVADNLYARTRRMPLKRMRPFTIGWNHNGADIEASIPSRGLPPGFDNTLQNLTAAPVILMVGTLEPRKGYTQALDAMELLWMSGNEYNLVVVGKQGWMMDDLCNRLNRHRLLNKKLYWFKGVSDEALKRLYAAADGLLMASEGEGFGLPLIEAAQYGCPILARDLPVFREVAGEHATYFSGSTASELATALQIWIKDLSTKNARQSTGMPWLTWKKSSMGIVNLLTNSQAENWVYRLEFNNGKSQPPLRLREA